MPDNIVKGCKSSKIKFTIHDAKKFTIWGLIFQSTSAILTNNSYERGKCCEQIFK